MEQGIQIRTKSQVGWPWMLLFQVSLQWPSWANPNADQVVSQVRWSEQRGHVAEVDGEAIVASYGNHQLLATPCFLVNSSWLFYPGSLSPSSSPPLQLAVSATTVPPIPTQSALLTHPFIRLRNSRNKCSMPKTWCAQQIPVMDVTWQPRRCSGAACQRKRCQGSKSQTAFFFLGGCRAGKISGAWNFQQHEWCEDRVILRYRLTKTSRWTSRCWMFKTRTPTLWSGSPTTSRRSVSTLYFTQWWRWQKGLQGFQDVCTWCSKLFNARVECGDLYNGMFYKAFCWWFFVLFPLLGGVCFRF